MTTTQQSRPVTALSQPGSDPETNLKLISSAALFGSSKQIEISHEGETYRLQITRSNKLILTK